MTTHPMQDIVLVEGVVRFRQNALVRYLLDAGNKRLNDLALLPNIPPEDWMQLYQLIGHSVSAYGGLDFVTPEVVAEADAKAAHLLGMAKDVARQCGITPSLDKTTESVAQERTRIAREIVDLYNLRNARLDADHPRTFHEQERRQLALYKIHQWYMAQHEPLWRHLCQLFATDDGRGYRIQHPVREGHCLQALSLVSEIAKSSAT